MEIPSLLSPRATRTVCCPGVGIHCAAGISRSSGAALAVIASKLEPGPASAMKAVQEVMKIKQIIHPNQNMVVDADDILGYQGSLAAAYRSTFQGGELLWVPPEPDEPA